MAKYVKGQSGNPKGRPKGSMSHKKIREAILIETAEIIASMIELAKGGDTTAAKLLLDRVFAPMKAGDAFISLPMTGNLSEDARCILSTIGSSAITPGQGQAILQGIASMTRIIEADEIVKRVEKLEDKDAQYQTTN